MRRASLFLFLVACKHDVTPAPAPSASSSAPRAPSVASASPARLEYAGTYTASAGTLYVPEGGPWDHFKFRGDDAGAIGEGSLTLVIETDGGALTGQLEGPLGPAALTGVATGSSLSFHVAPTGAPDTLRFSGTATGFIDAGAASGEMHLSSWHGNVLRDAMFQVSSPPARRPPE